MHKSGEGAEAWSEAGVFRGPGADGTYYGKVVPALFLRAPVPERGHHGEATTRELSERGTRITLVPARYRKGGKQDNRPKMAKPPSC